MKDKKKAKELSKKLGFNLSEIMRALLKQFLREKKIDF